MRVALLFLVIIVASAAKYVVLETSGNVTFHWPLVYQSGDKYLLLSSLNTKLAASHFKPLFPNYIVFSTPKQCSTQMGYWGKVISAASAKLNDSDIENSPGDLDGVMGTHAPYSGNHSACYIGSPAGAADLLAGLADIVYSEQANMIGWRYMNQVHWGSAGPWSGKLPPVWAQFKNMGKTVLYAYSEGDDGTDFETAFLPVC